MDRRTADGGSAGAANALADADSAHATVDEHGFVTEWNAGAERLLGYTSNQIVGRPAAGLLADDIPGDELRSILRLPRWNGTATFRHRDGHRVTARILAHHRTLRAGGRDWFLVSALVRPAPHLDEDHLVSQSFIKAADCAMAVYDTGLRLRRANEAMERTAGLSEEDMRGLRMTEFAWIPQLSSLESVEAQMRRATESGEPQYAEFHLRSRAESRTDAWAISVTPLKDPLGHVQGLFVCARDISEQYSARRRLLLLAAASSRIGSTLDVTRTAQELADVTAPDFADFVGVDLLPSLDDLDLTAQATKARHYPVALRRVAHKSVLPGVPEAFVALGDVQEYPAGSPPAETLISGRPTLTAVTDPAFAKWMSEDPRRGTLNAMFGAHSVLTVPLSARGLTLGTAVFVRHRHPDSFDHDDLVLAHELAARAAVCIDNARRYGHERSTAVALQRSLLPQRLPEQTAMDVAFRYLPAGGRAGVGGDWFDVIPLSGARVALVVGDVVGHGLHATATMGRLRTAVRTLADIELPPDELLTHLDDMAARLSTEEAGNEQAVQEAENAGGIGATCLYAVYDPVSRYCSLARAGHPMPVVVRPDGSANLIELPAGPPLGIGGLPFEAVEVELPEGSLLALYTNGLIESREQDIDTGLSHLCASLTRPATSLDDLCDTVLDTVLPQWPADDLALLVARTKALDTSHVATWNVPADPAAVARLRESAADRLVAWDLDDAGFVVELVVSELVTNAIRYGAPPIQLRLIHEKSLICEVSDASGTAPHMRRARTYDEGGRGLLLVAQLTQRWGTRHTAHGKTIWAELPLPPA
ncbi:SpoIIE family protein phosphatase [Streptomyces puniciscabiei]